MAVTKKMGNEENMKKETYSGCAQTPGGVRKREGKTQLRFQDYMTIAHINIVSIKLVYFLTMTSMKGLQS